MPRLSRIPAHTCIVVALFLAVAIQAQLPSAPVLSSPANGADQPLMDTLRWDSVSGASISSYNLEVSSTATFSTTLINGESIDSTSYFISGLTSTITYYWRVNATNIEGTSAWSSIWSFVPIPPDTSKTIWVKVFGHNGTSTTILSNASVGFTQGATVLGGFTDSTGIYQIPNAPFRSDTITVADTLYIARQLIIFNNVISGDTILDTLTKAMPGTVQRSLRGTAYELPANGTEPVAPGVSIIFKCNGGWVFAATSLTNGTWSVVGIPDSTIIPPAGAIPAYNFTTHLGLMATLAGWDPYYNNHGAITIGAIGTTLCGNILINCGCNPAPGAPSLFSPTDGAINQSTIETSVGLKPELTIRFRYR